MIRSALYLLCTTALFAQHPARQSADGWIQLFDGESLYGWSQEGTAKWRVADNSLIADTSGKGYLRNNTVFANFILKCEFKQGADGNSGIFIRSAKEGQPHETGYEVQIWDQHEKFPTGSLVNHIAAKKVKLKPDEWHSYEIEANGDHFTVTLDGKKILDGKDAKSRMGHIGLQANEGKPIAFRNIMLKPLGLAPLFDGKSLNGWKVVDTPNAKQKPEWSVKAGMLHVEKGPGQLETERTFQNFVLQLDIRTNTTDPKRHPNSGVFMRGDSNGFWTGYESQIRNEYKDDDPKQPIDFGTGAIYRQNPARKIVAKDNEFFSKTIVANGRHFSVWVNGFQVTDWDDTNPEGMDVRKKEARIAPGTLSLQAHDPTTNLDFKNIRLAELK